jgi:hypothetical protein
MRRSRMTAMIPWSARTGCGRWSALLVLSLAALLPTRGAALQATVLLHGRNLGFRSDNLVRNCSADSAALDDESVTKIGGALATSLDSAAATAFSHTFRDSIRWWADSVGRMLTLVRERDDNALASRYAPILRFAPGERFFPTLPFYSAFDSSSKSVPLDTLMDWVLPMQSMRLDRAAYAWSLVGKDRSTLIHRRVWHGTTWDRRPSLSSLQKKYLGSLRKAGVQSPRPIAAVLYRVCDLTVGSRAHGHRLVLSMLGAAQEVPDSEGQNQLSDVWRYLKGDEQAWHRSGLDTLVSPADAVAPPQAAAEDSCGGLSESTPMRVVEYFLYYLADQGLEGHPHDMESVFVFVPREPRLARCLRIVVGAGHKDPAPNNVLVFVGDEAGKRRFEQQNVLVEFGGHSSAPDLPPFGQFSAGLDVNWHVDELWGTRDKQASAGVEYHGRYEGGMTYPREPEDAVTILPTLLDESSRALLEPLVRLPQAKLAKTVLEYYRDTLATKRHEGDEFGHQQELASRELDDLTSRVLSRYQSVTGAWQGYERPGEDSLFFMKQQGDSSLRAAGLDTVRFQALASLLASITSPKINKPDVAATEIAATLRAAADSGSVLGRQESVLRAAIKDKLRGYVPPADSVDTLKTLVDILQRETNAKLLPLYNLVPIDHLRRLYQSARESDTLRADPSRGALADAAADTASKYFRLVVLSLRGAGCPLQQPRPGCDLMEKEGGEFDTLFSGYAGCASSHDVGCLLNSGDAVSKARVVHLIAAWDTGGLYATRGQRNSARRISGTKLYKPWEHELYHSPTEIFRPHLFRPNTLQTKGDPLHLLTFGVTLTPRSAATPHWGMIIPTIPSVPVKVPGYVEVQVGPYLSWIGHGPTRSSFAGSLLYASRYAYFWGWFVKGTFITSRDYVERRDDSTWFTLTAGPTFWLPFGMLKPVHLRTGLRFDVHRWTPKLSTAAWDLEIDLHQ